MLPAMLGGGPLAISHWTVVVAIAALFLVVQLVLSLRLYGRARRQEQALSELCHDLAQGGDGRGEARWTPAGFTWLRWVLAVFPEDRSARRSGFSRDDVLQELDVRLASNADYLLLQRLGVMAPLLGVVLTVVGFYFLHVDDSGEQSLSSILLAVAPLVSGVGAGAVLALVNQVLLHAVGVRFESLRTTARAWFDSAIWSRLPDRESPALAGAVQAIEQFAAAVTGSADRHTTSSVRLEESTAAIGRAALHFREVVKAFSGEVKGVPQSLLEIRSAMSTAATALGDLVPMGTRAVSNLDVSVAAFRTTIDREFAQAARLQHHAGQQLQEAVQLIAEATGALHASGAELQRTLHQQTAEQGQRAERTAAALDGLVAECTRAAAQAAAAQTPLVEAARELADSSGQLWQTLESDVAPAQRTLRESAASFAESAAQLTEFIRRGLSPAARDLAALHETLAGLQESVKSLQAFSHARADIDQLTDALARSAEIADALSALPERVREVLEQNAKLGLRVTGSRTLKDVLPGRPR